MSESHSCHASHQSDTPPVAAELPAPSPSSHSTATRRTARALRAFKTGAFELAASELARCSADVDPLAQLRVAREMESLAQTTLQLGKLLVRFELADPRAPATVRGQHLLDQLEGTLRRLEKRAGLQDCETARMASAAPLAPSGGPGKAEEFLVSRLSASASFLRSPFGAGGNLRLVERNRNGYDIWWGGCFFALPHGHSPYLAFLLIRVLMRVRHDLRSWIPRWVRPLRARLGRLVRLLLRRSTARSDAARHPAVLRVPLLRLSATRTGLEMQLHLAGPAA